MRLALIAVIPAVVALAYVLVQVRQRWVLVIGGAVSSILLVGTATPQIVRGGQPIISAAACQELQAVRDTFRGHALEPERTLVVAMHGLEWWSAWVLHTHIAQPQALRAENRQRFDRVLFLEVKNGLPFPGGGGPGGPPRFPIGPPGGFGGSPRRSARGDRGRAFGPPGPLPGSPSSAQPGPFGGGTMLPPRGPMLMMGPPIPSDAETVHESAFLRLARVRTPPDFLAVSPFP